MPYTSQGSYEDLRNTEYLASHAESIHWQLAYINSSVTLISSQGEKKFILINDGTKEHG